MPFISRLFEKAKKQGLVYNSLDAMKLFAIVNMTADHIGAYFFHEAMWWRAVGRITFPVWFFLVGYSRSRAFGTELCVYAVLMVAVHPFVGYPVFPLNALASIIFCRVMLNLCADFKLVPKRLPELIAAFTMLSLYTMSLFEYGTVAFLYALLGRMVKEKQTRHLTALVISSYIVFIAWMAVLFPFNIFQLAYVILGTAWVVKWLARCPITPIWPDWTASRFKIFITLLSRNTLPYYFYHRVIFQIIAALLLGKGLVFSFHFFKQLPS